MLQFLLKQINDIMSSSAGFFSRCFKFTLDWITQQWNKWKWTWYARDIDQSNSKLNLNRLSSKTRKFLTNSSSLSLCSSNFCFIQPSTDIFYFADRRKNVAIYISYMWMNHLFIYLHKIPTDVWLGTNRFNSSQVEVFKFSIRNCRKWNHWKSILIKHYGSFKRP